MKVFCLTAIIALTCVKFQMAEIDLTLSPTYVVLCGVHGPGSIPYNPYRSWSTVRILVTLINVLMTALHLLPIRLVELGITM